MCFVIGIYFLSKFCVNFEGTELETQEVPEYRRSLKTGRKQANIKCPIVVRILKRVIANREYKMRWNDDENSLDSSRLLAICKCIN